MNPSNFFTRHMRCTDRMILISEDGKSRGNEARQDLDAWYRDIGRDMYIDKQGKEDAREKIVKKKKAKKEVELEEPDVSVHEPERRQSKEPQSKKRKIEYRAKDRHVTEKKQPESESETDSESSSSGSEEEIDEDTELRGVIPESQKYEVYLDENVFVTQ